MKKKNLLDSEELLAEIGEDYKEQLEEEIELLDGASAEFDMDLVSKGQLSPVFFGSALTNFGVETFLQHFLQMTTSPLRESQIKVRSIRSLRISVHLCLKSRRI
mgnify:CR=1 FL=1